MSDISTSEIAREHIQNITEQAMSPQCFAGQHEICKRTLSYLGDDNVGRTMECPCRCHNRAPVAAEAGKPEQLYRLSWEYEASQAIDNPDDRPLSAWLKRRILTTSKEIAGDWIEAVAELTKTNKVRNLIVLRAEIGKWEKIG